MELLMLEKTSQSTEPSSEPSTARPRFGFKWNAAGFWVNINTRLCGPSKCSKTRFPVLPRQALWPSQGSWGLPVLVARKHQVSTVNRQERATALPELAGEMPHTKSWNH